MSTEAAATQTTRPAVESEQGLLIVVLIMVVLGVAGMFLMTV